MATSESVLKPVRTIPRERVDLAERLYLAGRSRPYIVKQLCKEYGVTTRTARRYIQRAGVRLAALPKPPPEVVFQRAEAMLLETYRLAKAAVKVVTFVDGDTKESKIMPAPETGVMGTVAVRLAELYGVVAPKRTELTGANGAPLVPTAPTFEEIRARFDALATPVGQEPDAGAVRQPDAD